MVLLYICTRSYSDVEGDSGHPEELACVVPTTKKPRASKDKSEKKSREGVVKEPAERS
jgi:hypothetical protein